MLTEVSKFGSDIPAAFGLILMILVAASSSVAAATIGFTCLTDNGGQPCSGFAGTFSGTVTATGTGFTATINNGGVSDGVITMVAVNAPGNGAGYSLTSLIESPPAIDFAIDGGLNAGLPGSGANVGAGFTSEFSAGAVPPSTTHGANAGESIGLVFTLTTPLSQSDLAALINSGALQFGLHVPSLGTREESEKFVNSPPGTPVPEPATMLLLGSGILIAARARRRQTT